MTTDEIKNETSRVTNLIGEKTEKKLTNFSPTQLPKTSGFQRHAVSNSIADALFIESKRYSATSHVENSNRVTTGRFNETRGSQISAKKYRNSKIYSSSNKYILCKIISVIIDGRS
jgi:hypothetical protein